MKLTTEDTIDLVAGNLLEHCTDEADYFFSVDYSNPEEIKKYFDEVAEIIRQWQEEKQLQGDD